MLVKYELINDSGLGAAPHLIRYPKAYMYIHHTFKELLKTYIYI